MPQLRRFRPLTLLAAVLLCAVLACLAPRACAAEDGESALTETNGISLLDFSPSMITAIGNQTSGKCSWFSLRYARSILDKLACSGAGMWSNGAVWSAGGYKAFSGDLSACLDEIYSELVAGRPVIIHVQNTYVDGAKKHANRVSSYEYTQTDSGWSVAEYPHISTSPAYGHWMCVVGLASDADPANLSESDFYALDPARVVNGGRLILTRLLDGTLWTSNSPLKISA